jgi:peptidoglycan/LPS O-acetylase OafA/YrhL
LCYNYLMKQNATYYYWLDLIRFLAALLVVLGHYRVAFFVEYGLLPATDKNLIVMAFYSITRLGHESVLIFFVLSGFLVGGKSIIRIREQQFDVKSYALDRSVRILLPLIGSLLIIIPIYMVCDIKIDTLQWLGNLLQLQGIFVAPVTGPLWSLSYEAWFYIFFGAIGVIFSTYVKERKPFIGFVILFICALIFTKLNASYLFIWLSGAICYLFIPVKPNKIVVGLAMLLSFAFLALLQLSYSSRYLASEGHNQQVLELCFSFCFAILICMIVGIRPDHKVTIAINRMSVPLAAFSYTLYLTHYPLMSLLSHYGFEKSKRIDLHSLGMFIFAVALSIVVAYLVYWVFEKRTPLVKKWIVNRLSAEAVHTNANTHSSLLEKH